MKIGELSRQEITARLKGPGLRWRTGPFTIHLKTSAPNLADHLRVLYQSHPLLNPPYDEVGDFHIHLSRGMGVRRWWRPKVYFKADAPSPFSPFPLDHALPLLEWGTNYCIASRAHQYLILHTGAVERNGRVLLLPGLPGSGKSTLTAALSLRGWRLFSDEFALVRPGTGRIAPLVRPIALKNESIAAIRRFDSNAQLGPEFPNTRKGTVAHLRPPPASVAADQQPAPPGWIVCPSFERGSSVTFEPLTQDQGFFQLAGNAFNYEVQGARGFRAVAQMAHHCPTWKMTFGNLEEAIEALEKLTDEVQVPMKPSPPAKADPPSETTPPPQTQHPPLTGIER
ncbi:MAG: HprK-related kinase A [Magnetococcales bacterium]|nr:HprK-related kinase A [Magnetococcales bacterium]